MSRDDVVLGIGDDAAILRPPAGRELVVAMDTLNSGVHFPGHRAGGHRLESAGGESFDLAAMGASPAWCVLSLSFPMPTPHYSTVFSTASSHLRATRRRTGRRRHHARAAVGVRDRAWLRRTGGALRRDAARVGDDVWVSGTLGDAAVRCASCARRRHRSGLRSRLDRPTPRYAGARSPGSRMRASSLDGLLQDLPCRVSRIARKSTSTRCRSPTRWRARNACAARVAVRRGDDYELCFTAPKTARLAVEAALALCDLQQLMDTSPRMRGGWRRSMPVARPGRRRDQVGQFGG
ncbi:MAG: AIR synthase related protein [Aquabacterium sp.]